jgi:xanthine dehydrogenase small subunit
MNISFYLNRDLVNVSVEPHQNTLTFLRETRGLTGAKDVCSEGDCGACAVALGEFDGQEVRYKVVNSCLLPVARVHGKHVVTVEGLAEADQLHPIQQAMIDEHAVQCGYCTSGVVLSLFCLFINNPTPSDNEIILSLDGSLCRCTGYASILKAARSLSKAGQSDQSKIRTIRPIYFDAVADQLRLINPSAGENKDYIIPHNLKELHSFWDGAANPSEYTMINGDTDIMVGVNLGKQCFHHIVDLSQIEEFTGIAINENHLTIGARATLSDVLNSEEIHRHFPALSEAVEQMCSTPIRNIATLIGNVCNASPIADTVPPLYIYGAVVILASKSGVRRVSLDKWFLGYRKTAILPGEVAIAVEIPISDYHASFEKTGKRKTLDIATVNSALALNLSGGRIQEAKLVYGGVAAVPFYASKTCDFLREKRATESVVMEASRIVADEISPIGDVRGSAEFRRQLAGNHLIKHFTKLLPEIFE